MTDTSQQGKDYGLGVGHQAAGAHGMYSDVETRCPVCGARLFRVNTTNSNNASQSNTAASSNGNGTAAGQKKMGTATRHLCEDGSLVCNLIL